MKKFLLLLVFILPITSFATTANFGYETIGSLKEGILTNWAVCEDYTTPADTDELISMSIALDSIDGTGVKLAVWTASGGTLVAVAPAITSGTGWQTSTLTTPVALSPSTVYCLGAIYGSTTGEWNRDGSTTRYVDTGNNFTSPVDFTSNATDSVKISLYATVSLTSTSTPPDETATSTASTTDMLLTGINFGIAIIITILSFGVVGYIFNTYNNRKKPWQK